MNNFLLACMITIISFSISLNAEMNRKPSPYEFNGDIPFDKSKLNQPKVVQKNRFEMNLNPNEVYQIRKKIEKKKNILDGVYKVNIMQNPIFKPLKTITTVYLHPNFISTLIFPKKYKINSKPQVSFPVKVFEYDSNTIRIRPSEDTTQGNIVLSLTDGIKNYSLTIFYKRYIPNINCTKDANNKCRNTALATVIKFVAGTPYYNPFKIIEEYMLLHNIKKLNIDKNLGYVTLSKGDETYYIIRDDEFGTIYKDGMLLKVQTKL